MRIRGGTLPEQADWLVILCGYVLLPLLLLQRLCAGRRLVSAFVPPSDLGMMWSAVSAPGLPQSAQGGFSARMVARLRTYSASYPRCVLDSVWRRFGRCRWHREPLPSGMSVRQIEHVV